MDQDAIARNLAAVENHFHSEDRVVDDSLVTFEVATDGYWHFPVGSRIEMRLVHIFEMRDGRIARELVFDMGCPV